MTSFSQQQVPGPSVSNTVGSNPTVGQPSPKHLYSNSRKKLLIGLLVLGVIFFLIVVAISRNRKEEGTTAGTNLISPGSGSPGNIAGGNMPTLSPSGATFIGLTRGTLGRGETATVNINLEGGEETLFYLNWTGPRPELTLTRPDGSIIDEDYTLGNLREVGLESSDSPPQLIYIVYQPVKGTWKMNITANDKIDYQAFATLRNQVPTAGGVVSPSVTLPPYIPTATQRPIQDSNNNKVVLTGWVSEKPIDKDGDGLYEYLEMMYEIDSGDFVEVEFKTQLGVGTDIVSESVDKVRLKKGIQRYPVIYYGADFLESELDGPYSVLGATIKPVLSNFVGDQKQNIFTTSSYQYSQFENIGSNL